MLDDREHGLRELLPSWPIAHLAVGDIWIGYSETQEILENGLIIERKSVADLEASILDNRYREQRSRIMAYATEKKAHAIYIIEGELDRLGHVRLTKQALLKYITRLSIRYHIPVFLTASLKETAELCKILHDQWTTDPKTFEQPPTLTYIETRGKTRESNTDDPNVFLATLLQACRGISSTGALAIISVFPSLEALMKGTVEEFTAIQVGKQRLGVVKATRLHTLLHNH
jgi:ERCC4-type nuclease